MTDQPKSARISFVDALRGVAIIAMMLYHALWDATLFGFVGTGAILSPPLMAVQAMILGSFILLAGASMALATRNGIAWPKFWRRFLFIAGGALAITAATVFLFPETYVFFGVLHALAVFSILGLLFLALPKLLVTTIGVVVVALPILWTDPVFMNRWIAWIGFYPTSPPTNDLVPIFPWFGVFLIGIAGMRWLLDRGVAQTLPVASGRIGRVLVLLGRWSLVIYLLHQPLLFGGFYAFNAMRPAPEPTREAEFIGSCEANCGTSNSLVYCHRYCGCALNTVIDNNLWDAIGSTTPTPEQQLAISTVTNACSSLSVE